MKITRLGHAAVLLEGTKTIIVDPFLLENPSATIKPEGLPHINFVLVTHDHFDHIGQAIEITKKNNATLVAIHELATSSQVSESGITAVGMNIGGTYSHQGINMSMTQAIHSAASGNPCGFVISMDGKTIYHAGDTAFFSDMSLIPKFFGQITVALLPIGGHYTMDVTQAIEAAHILKPEKIIPIHYNTWSIIKADPTLLQEGYGKQKVIILQPGESISL